jgi:hypothetical protein
MGNQRVRFLVMALVAFSAGGPLPAADEPDFLKAAVDFAECMITYGRDRYGEVQSPLFAVLLTRENEPRIGPYPLFAEKTEKARRKHDQQRREAEATGRYVTPFLRFNFNECLNYPQGLAAEGPHKVTLYGCDLYEDRELYYMLLALSRITGDPKYAREAEAAVMWWFENTQGLSGLYPWGEHLGWDFEHDCPTYFAGPSKHLYAACYHEVKDRIPFLDYLARLPAETPGQYTPLEKYALGIWAAHFWDQEKCYYCRHGDYTGEDPRTGSPAGFPAHLGAYMSVWAAALLETENPEFRREMTEIFAKVVDSAIARAEKFGFVPFDFKPDIEELDPGVETPGQSLRLAHHAVDLGAQLADAFPALSAKLRKLARLHLKDDEYEDAVWELELYKRTGDKDYLQGTKAPKDRPEARVRDLSGNTTPGAFASEIIRNLEYYRQYGDAAYLNVAETHGRTAYAMFCDDACPLPKARAGAGEHATPGGEAFPDFYFRGAMLMKAFALLGEALRRP